MPLIEKIEKRRKCGEIYVTDDFTLDFLCVLCEASVFEEIENFVEHVKKCQLEINEYVNNLVLQPDDSLESGVEYKFDIELGEETINIPEKSNGEWIKQDIEDMLTIITENNDSECTNEKDLVSKNEETQRTLNDKKLQVKKQEIDKSMNNFSCQICNKMYALRSSVQRHIKKKHPEVNIDSPRKINEFILNVEQVFPENNNGNRIITVEPIIPDVLATPIDYDNSDDTENGNEENTTIPNESNKMDVECIKTIELLPENDSECTNEEKLEKNSKKMFSCKYCQRTYFLKSSLQRHFKRNHSNVSINKGSKILKKSKKQKKKSNLVKIECEFCNKIYDLKSSLHSHVLRKHKSEMFPCDNCCKKFISKNSLEKHKIANHNSLEFLLSLPENCNKSEAITNPITDEDDGKIIIQTTEIADPLTCRYCFKRAKSKIERIEHEYTHTMERPYKCKICGKNFQYCRNYKTHLKVHLNERKHKCDMCSASFNDISNLHVHIRRHKGEKKFKCSYCEKRFISTSERKFHERIHTGERPYQCQLCGKCFTTSGKLSLHNKRHTGHKPHKCDICDKRFYLAKFLKDHMIIHTGEKPFVCRICNAAFASKSTFKSHEKLHSDVRGYVCEFCGESFKQHAGLYSHKKIHGLPLKSLVLS